MYGLIEGLPGRKDKLYYHKLDRIEEAILDLYQARKADLIVVDGTYTTFHVGPRPIKDFVETFRLDLTLAGFDPVAVDTIGAKVLGFDPQTIRYLKWGAEKGLGTNDQEEIELLGTPIDEAYIRRADGTIEFANRKLKMVKALNYGACTGCIKLALQTLRFGEAIFKEKLYLVMGPEANAASLNKDVEEDGRIILCGYCAAPTFYNELEGDFITGCPPSIEDLQKKYREISIK
jgi:hypothetical protein